jgi:hypothetical protein
MKAKNPITVLKSILKKGVMSPMLKQAVEAIIIALNDKNLNLAYQLSVVKSFITGVLDPKDKVHAFQENCTANEKLFGEGNDIYSLLDGIHFSLAMKVDKMPSGMMIMSGTPQGNVNVTEMKRIGSHPIIKRIKAERKAVYATLKE